MKLLKFDKNNRMLLIFLLIFFISIGSFFLFNSFPIKTKAELSNVEYQKEYEVNSEITLQAATIKINGESVDAGCSIRFPDGKEYSGNTIELSAIGDYEIIYSCTYKNNLYSKSIGISVYEPLVKLKDKYLSSYYYGSHDVYDETGEGLCFELMTGTEVCFNQIINLNNLTLSDPFFSFYVLPKTVSIADVQEIYIYLQDVYDEDNIVKINAHYNSAYPQCSWWMACAPHQEYAGYSIKGTKYGTSNLFGASGLSFAAVSNQYAPFQYYLPEFSMRYDNATQSFYNSAGRLIMSLSDREIFNNVWNGFTTGEVRLSFEILTYENSATVFVTDVLGCDLSQNKVVDEEGPEIRIDFKGNDPTKLIAKNNVPFNLFDVTAVDVQSGVLNDEVKIKVYKDYKSSFQTRMNIEDNQFVPNGEGKYAIVYEAEDNLGNVTTKIYSVTVENNPQKPSITLSDDKIVESYAGEKIKIADIVSVDSIGDYSIETSVLSPDNEDIYSKGHFTPLSIGTYTVKYIIKDYLGQTAEVFYSVNIKAGKSSVFYENVKLPKYVLAGHTYEMPILYAYGYNDDSEEIRVAKVAIYYTADSYSDVVNSGEEYTFREGYDGDIVVTYYDDVYQSNKQTYDTTSVNTNNNGLIAFDKYFVTENVVATQKSDYIEMKCTGDKASFEFIQKLLTSVFDCVFIVEKNNNITSIELLFVDYNDQGQEFSIKFQRKKEGLALYINGSYSTDVDYSFNADGLNSQFSVSIENNTLRTSGISIDLSKYDISEYSYLKMNITGGNDSKIQFHQLLGQYFNEMGMDFTAPVVKVEGVLDTLFNIGDTYCINNKVTVFDVLDPNVTVFISVKDPNNNYVTAKDGTILNNAEVGCYEIELTKYGKYSVIYIASDTYYGSDSNSNAYEYSVTVLDDVPPVITVSKEILTESSVGETISIPTATVTDNLAVSNIGIKIYMMDPSNKVTIIKDNMSFTFEKAGLHRLVYMAFDESNNIGTLTIEINIKEEK